MKKKLDYTWISKIFKMNLAGISECNGKTT